MTNRSRVHGAAFVGPGLLIALAACGSIEEADPDGGAVVRSDGAPVVPAADATPAPDAPVADAATPTPDAAVPPDASARPDAAVPPDASARPDAAVPPDASARPDAAGPPDASARPDAASLDEPPFPAAPIGDGDPRFAVAGVPRWSIISNDLTAGDDLFRIEVRAPAGTERVDLWGVLHGIDPVWIPLTRDGDRFYVGVDVSEVGPSDFEIRFSADGSATAFASRTVTRSHPLYVFVSTDWDTPDNTDVQLRRHTELHRDHPSLRITHFVGPYTFTDPELSERRKRYLADWAIGMRDTYGDEIGTHIHPYCTFVEAAGLDCATSPSFSRPGGDSTGYSVYLGTYSEREMSILLETNREIFTAWGLGQPTSFRAGGWTAEIHTLAALASAGYAADASACNWSRLEEWRDHDSTLYDWTRSHWASIGDTSQPYHPNRYDILLAAPPQLSILEVPDNGLLVDYVTATEMVDIFDANWPGGALPEPRVYSIGWHPPNFSPTYQRQISTALDHVDRYLADDDNGPVIYATASELPRVWPAPE